LILTVYKVSILCNTNSLRSSKISPHESVLGGLAQCLTLKKNKIWRDIEVFLLHDEKEKKKKEEKVQFFYFKIFFIFDINILKLQKILKKYWFNIFLNKKN